MKYLWCLLVLFGAPARAQAVYAPTWSWQAPTVCADGTATANCPITKYNLYTGLQGQPLTLWGTVTPDKTSVATPGTPAGIWCGQVSASDAGGEGIPTTPICITLSAAVLPGTPGTPTVALTTSSTIAYMLVPGKDTYGVLIVGSVPLSTPCVAAKPVLTYFVVPSAQVTFTSGIKPPVVLANCS